MNSEIGKAITIAIIGGVFGRLIGDIFYDALKSLTAGPRGTSSSRLSRPWP